MKNSRCPYHVKQGMVDNNGKLVLSDICGVRSACGAVCSLAPFDKDSHKTCSRYVTFTRGTERAVLLPKNEMEFLPELNGIESFSEIDLL
jgi:hypothetical protein